MWSHTSVAFVALYLKASSHFMLQNPLFVYMEYWYFCTNNIPAFYWMPCVCLCPSLRHICCLPVSLFSCLPVPSLYPPWRSQPFKLFFKPLHHIHSSESKSLPFLCLICLPLLLVPVCACTCPCFILLTCHRHADSASLSVFIHPFSTLQQWLTTTHTTFNALSMAVVGGSRAWPDWCSIFKWSILVKIST